MEQDTRNIELLNQTCYLKYFQHLQQQHTQRWDQTAIFNVLDNIFKDHQHLILNFDVQLNIQHEKQYVYCTQFWLLPSSILLLVAIAAHHVSTTSTSAWSTIRWATALWKIRRADSIATGSPTVRASRSRHTAPGVRWWSAYLWGIRSAIISSALASSIRVIPITWVATLRIPVRTSGGSPRLPVMVAWPSSHL